MERITITRPEGERRYLLVLPERTSTLSLPALIFLPGTGSTAEWAATETLLPEFAHEHSFVLVIPEAQPLHPDRPVKFLTNPSRWNDGAEFLFDPSAVLADDCTFLLQVIADLLDRAHVDRRRIFLSGFSNGASMAFRFAIEHSEMLAAIAPVAGYCWDQKPRLKRPVPTLYILGEADPLIPYRGGEVRLPWGNRFVRRPAIVSSVESWAEALGCDLIPQRKSESATIHTDCYHSSHGVDYHVVTLRGHGHHWPGGKGQLNPRIAGPRSLGVSGNERIWDFLSKHSL